jgi:hypothetical protein
MDDRYANLRALQERARDQVDALNQRLNAVSRPTHPNEFSADFRELEKTVAELREAANAFFS